MFLKQSILFYIFCLAQAVNNRFFPRQFKFGAASASYQIEGAWNQDGKGENIWDRMVHSNPGSIKNSDNGDMACDSYNKYEEDVQLLRNLGVNHYRLSLSWSRLLPTGYTNQINQKAVQYYRNLFKELLRNGIEPMVTLYHWDLPQSLQEIGGWPNEKLVEHFVNYARLSFELFGDLVKWWATFNEPKQICQEGYGSGVLPPTSFSPGIGEYLCAHTILKAHAQAWHIYDKEFRSEQKGRISIVLDSDWAEPNTEDDQEAAETHLQFFFGWFADPIFKGNYPQIMIDRVSYRSALEGFNVSRLPQFTLQEIDNIRGTHDYMALNSYTSTMVSRFPETPISVPNYFSDMGVLYWQDLEWESTASIWLRVVPWGLRKLLVWLKNNYDNPEIIITENGMSDYGTLDDIQRIKYLQEYMSAILDAIYEDGVNVQGYTVWSLMDNFEWLQGYTEKFGLYQVDFSSPNRTRTPKKSVDFYKKVVSTHCLVDTCID